MNPAALVVDLRSRGFTLLVADGSLRVSPASALTSSARVAIRADLPALITHRAPGEVWDQGEAIRLMYDADTLVDQLEVDGTLPDVAAAASVVAGAFATLDIETVRFAVGEFTVLVCSLWSAAARRVG